MTESGSPKRSLPPTQDKYGDSLFLYSKEVIHMLIADLIDTYFPCDGFTNIRNTVRAIVYDVDGNIQMLKIVGEDSFGVRNHYETPGGGVEAGEDFETALHRELEEELGVVCSIDAYLGIVVSRYNLLKRINVERYYVCTIVDKKTMHRTDSELVLIQGVESKPLESWIQCLKNAKSPVDRLVQNRDLSVLQHLAAKYNKK